jgi:hypothetical protein
MDSRKIVGGRDFFYNEWDKLKFHSYFGYRKLIL